jgi:hypothetical protein
MRLCRAAEPIRLKHDESHTSKERQVRYWHFADIRMRARDVRLLPQSGHRPPRLPSLAPDIITAVINRTVLFEDIAAVEVTVVVEVIVD